MNKNIDNVKQEIVDTITDRRTFLKKVKVKINYKSQWKRILAEAWILPKYHTKKIYLSNLWPGTVMRLLTILLDINKIKSFEETEVYTAIKGNIPLFVDFLAIGLHNAETTPPQWLKRALTYQFTPEEILQNSIEVYRRLDVQTFFVITQSLVDLQSLNHILEAEAHGQSSGTSVSTTDGASAKSSGE